MGQDQNLDKLLCLGYKYGGNYGGNSETFNYKYILISNSYADFSVVEPTIPFGFHPPKGLLKNTLNISPPIFRPSLNVPQSKNLLEG